MLKIMKDAYYAYTQNADYMSDGMADFLLERLEQSGLQPPFCYEIYYKTWRKNGDGHEWEEEDEKI